LYGNQFAAKPRCATGRHATEPLLWNQGSADAGKSTMLPEECSIEQIGIYSGRGFSRLVSLTGLVA